MAMGHWQVGLHTVYHGRQAPTLPPAVSRLLGANGSTGYVGEDVDQAVHRLLIAANYDVRRAEAGIICLDEFDKIAKPKSMHGAKDISGEVLSYPAVPCWV